MRYKNADEITKAFIESGWSKDTSFFEIRLESDPETVFFMMDNGNIYKDNGNLYCFNIPSIAQKQKPIPPIVPPLTRPYYGDKFRFV